MVAKKLNELIDQSLLMELAQMVKTSGLAEIEIESDGLRIKVVANQLNTGTASAHPLVQQSQLPVAPTAMDAPPQASLGSSGQDRGNEEAVTSPMVGTIYHSAEPGGEPFVKPGYEITKGDTLFIVEAMKMMNHIPSPVSGVVREILVENGQPVEFGEALVIIGGK